MPTLRYINGFGDPKRQKASVPLNLDDSNEYFDLATSFCQKSLAFSRYDL